MKLCLVCSHGGHLSEMLQLSDAFKCHDHFFVIHGSESINNIENGYQIKFDGWTFTGKILLTKVIIKAIYVLLKERPDVIISTGAGEIAVPFCYVGKMLGMKIVFIETLARVTTPSGGGRLIYPITDLFLVQWSSMLKIYGKKAKYWGRII